MGLCRVEVKPPGPDQLYVTPGVGELPRSNTEVLMQVSVPVAKAEALIVQAFAVLSPPGWAASICRQDRDRISAKGMHFGLKRFMCF